MKFLSCFVRYYFEVMLIIYFSSVESKNDGVDITLKAIRPPKIITKLLFPGKKAEYVSVPYLIAICGPLFSLILGLAASLIICAYDLDVEYMVAVKALGTIVIFLTSVAFLILVFLSVQLSVLTKVIAVLILVAGGLYLFYLLMIVLLRSGDELCTLFFTPFYYFIAEP